MKRGLLAALGAACELETNVSPRITTTSMGCLAMSREADEPHDGPDPDSDPYAAPRDPLGPERGRSRPAEQSSLGVRGPISVTHDLSDDDLRLYEDCDAFYDPRPLFGFIPQWVWLIPITASIGCVFGMLRMGSSRAAFVSAPALSVVVLAVMVAMARARRNTARLAGLCEDRTLTITPEGFSLTIPGAHPAPKELASVGPVEHPWGDVREIEATEDFVTFWRKGPSRLVLPRRAFPGPAEADAFLQAAILWHAEAACPASSWYGTGPTAPGRAMPGRWTEVSARRPTSPSGRSPSMNDEPEHAVASQSLHWRRWAVMATVVLGLAMQAWLRSSGWRGIVVSAEGEALVYRPSAWWLAIFAGPAALMVLIGVAIVTVRHPLARLIGGVVLLASLASLIMIPATIMAGSLVVTAEGFTHTAGFWWDPVTRAIRFDSLEALRVVPEPKGDGPPSFVLECRERDGEVVKIPSSDVLKAGLREIMIRAVRRGVAREDAGRDDAGGPE